MHWFLSLAGEQPIGCSTKPVDCIGPSPFDPDVTLSLKLKFTFPVHQILESWNQKQVYFSECFWASPRWDKSSSFLRINNTARCVGGASVGRPRKDNIIFCCRNKKFFHCIFLESLFETEIYLNQIFHYTRCITLKRVTSWRGPPPHHCARATQLHLKKCRSGGKPLTTLCR